MSLNQQHGDKVFCFVCNNPAVKKRIFCGDCGKWSHVSCGNKKKCCDESVNIPNSDGEGNLVDTINSLSMAVKDMKNVIEELVNENKKLRQEIEVMKAEKQQTNHRDPVVEDSVVEEVVERMKRSTNVVIRGIPECQGTIAQQKEADGLTVKNLIKLVIPDDSEYNILNIVRLGKANSTRSRMIKVMFNNSTTVQKLVRHRFNNNVFFNLDLTRIQQEKAYTIRKEFKRRCDNGEKGIRLKYNNGLPRIVEEKNE